MHIILVANPKGGSGKTTIAVNLAGYYASAGRRTGLFDLDRQQSALRWLARRPAGLATIRGFDARADDVADDVEQQHHIAAVSEANRAGVREQSDEQAAEMVQWAQQGEWDHVVAILNGRYRFASNQIVLLLKFIRQGVKQEA